MCQKAVVIHRYSVDQTKLIWILFFRLVILEEAEEKDLSLLLERRAVNLPLFQLDRCTLLDKVRPSEIKSFNWSPVI